MPPSVTLFGPLDVLLGDWIEFVLLGLVLVNMGARAAAHRSHVRQADEGGAETISRHSFHEATNVLLVLASFYYLTLHHHGGVIMSMLVVGMVVADFFEFEARKVEARRDVPLERPKGAITASVFVLLYAGFQSLFFVVEPVWSAVV